MLLCVVLLLHDWYRGIHVFYLTILILHILFNTSSCTSFLKCKMIMVMTTWSLLIWNLPEKYFNINRTTPGRTLESIPKTKKKIIRQYLLCAQTGVGVRISVQGGHSGGVSRHRNVVFIQHPFLHRSSALFKHSPQCADLLSHSRLHCPRQGQTHFPSCAQTSR